VKADGIVCDRSRPEAEPAAGRHSEGQQAKPTRADAGRIHPPSNGLEVRLTIE
jgi:hypothetical protein